MSKQHPLESPPSQEQGRFAGARRLLDRTAFIAGMAAAAGTAGFIAGVTSPTETEIGPHRATVELALPTPWINEKPNKLAANEQLNIDFGPLGSIYTITPLRLGDSYVGAHAVIKEIPSENGSSWAATHAAYEQFLSEAGRASTAETIKQSLIKRGALYGGGAAAITSVALAFPRPRRRTANVLKSKSIRLGAMGVYSAVALTGSVALDTRSVEDFTGNVTLADAGLKNADTEGLIFQTGVNSFLQKGIEEVRKYDETFNTIKHNYSVASAAKLAEEAQAPSELHTYLASRSTTSFLWTSDIHCNAGMMEVAAHIIKSKEYAALIDSGDLTMGGTAAEKQCVAIFRQRVPEDTPIIEALGNHDDRIVTARQAEELGYIVLTGQIEEVAGFRIMGYASPMRSKFGEGYHNDSDQSLDELGLKAATEACNAGNISLMVIHEPAAAEQTAKDGCAWLTLSGHTHKPAGPFAYQLQEGSDAATSYMLINGSTGGAAHNKLTISSQLGQNATLISLEFDNETKKPLAYRLITIQPNKNVIIGDLIPFGPIPSPPKSNSSSPDNPLAQPSTAAPRQ